MINRTLYKYSLVVGLAFLTSCEGLDLVPEDRFTEETYWTTIEKAQSSLNNAYMQILSSHHFFYNEALSDNAVNGRGDEAGAASIAAGTFDASLPRFKDEWNQRYAGIKSCVLILENIDKIKDADPIKIERMKAEAKVIRAYHYFMLTTWFGDVPLFHTDPTLEEASTAVRTPKAEVIEFVLNELDDAMAVLPTKDQYAEAERGKITSGAALALKARVLLYEGRWQEVVTATDRLINKEKGSYGLFPSYSGLFLPENEYSNEDIFSIQYVPIQRMWNEFFDMAPLSAGARLNALAPTQELVDSYVMLNGKNISESGSGFDKEAPYENRDPRLTATVVYDQYKWKNESGAVKTIYIKPNTDPTGAGLDEYQAGSSKTTTGYYTRKYWDPTHLSGLQSGLNLMVIRYADVLLMNAEARNELGQFSQTTWNETIKALRVRAGFTDAGATAYPSGLSQTQMRDLIRTERRTELAMEGLRIFDIRRWKLSEQVLNGWAHGARFGIPSEDDGYLRVSQRNFDPSMHYLWPIPRAERQINTALTQNPGY
ncbi:RagB/SusD family nutrient uptake outer membrane protein [Chryseobacterium sp. A321]